MTPLEKAVEAGRSRNMMKPAPPGIAGGTLFGSDDARAIIRAFLEAAAEDHEARVSVAMSIECMQQASFMAQAEAAILALKETING